MRYGNLFQTLTLATAISLGLTACTNTVTAPLIVAPAVEQKQTLMSVSEVIIVDKRNMPALAVINGTQTPSDAKLIGKLQDWLNGSIQTAQSGRKSVTFNLLNYASYVSQESFSFNAESMMEWEVVIEEKRRTWKKSFQTTVNEEGPLKKDPASIEATLTKMAHSLLVQTLNDPEFKQAIVKR